MVPRTRIGSVVNAHVSRQHGVVLLAILLFLLVTTMAVGSMVQMYQTQVQRENEEELLFIGEQFRRAIQSYHSKSPGSVKTFPTSLDALIDDNRFPTPVHHLRRVYADPLTGTVEWGLISNGGGISGVYSLSQKPPFKRSGFPARYRAFEGKANYSDWKFEFTPTLHGAPLNIAK